jgi:hypothetical protein
MADTTGETPQLDLDDDRLVPDEHLAYAPPSAERPETPPPPGAGDSTTTDEPWRPIDDPAPADGLDPDEPADRAGIRLRTLVMVSVLAAVLGAALSGLFVALVLNGDSGPERVIERIETQIVPAQADGLPTATAVARRVLPSIVTVEV